MTEADWLTATDPRPMLEFLRGQASDRKLRLFTCACYREGHSRIPDAGDLPWELSLAERFAEHGGNTDAFRKARSRLGARGGYSAAWALNGLHFLILGDDAQPAAESSADLLSRLAFFVMTEQGAGAFEQASAERNLENSRTASKMRCIFGTPFRPVAFDPTWRSETVAALATGVYAERAFDRLPILADALEEAGCDHPDILNHCRGPGPHVRGCWAVDLVLGKS